MRRWSLTGGACLLTLFMLGTIYGQSDGGGTRLSTIAKLQARAKTLEEENGRLKRDYEVLLTVCQSHAVADPVPKPPPSSAERAAAALANDPSGRKSTCVTSSATVSRRRSVAHFVGRVREN